MRQYLIPEDISVIYVAREGAKSDYDCEGFTIKEVISMEYIEARTAPLNAPCGFNVIQTEHGVFHRTDSYWCGSPYGWHKGRPT